MALLKAGAETDKRDENDKLAIELAPDNKVRPSPDFFSCGPLSILLPFSVTPISPRHQVLLTYSADPLVHPQVLRTRRY